MNDQYDPNDPAGVDTAEQVDDQRGGGIADVADNEELEHTDADAPETTRSDALDAGVPMLPGESDEPQGPEDALGPGAKRGDYAERQPEGTVHTEAVPVEGGGQPVYAEGEDGEKVQVDVSPHTALVEQNPRAEMRGEVPGEKGGVDTA